MSRAQHRSDIGEIINSLRQLQAVGRRQTADFVRKYKITGQQLGALRIITLSPRICLGELSDRLFLHISTVSGIVDRLEKRGYVTRERCAEDRRVVQLDVTPAGRQVIKRTPLAGMGLLLHTIDQLPSGNVDEILRGLRLLLDVMNISAGSKSNGIM